MFASLSIGASAQTVVQSLRRHDRIKSYRFLLAVAGCMLIVLFSDKPEAKLTLFPAVSHALLVVADQVWHCKTCRQNLSWTPSFCISTAALQSTTQTDSNVASTLMQDLHVVQHLQHMPKVLHALHGQVVAI